MKLLRSAAAADRPSSRGRSPRRLVTTGGLGAPEAVRDRPRTGMRFDLEFLGPASMGRRVRSKFRARRELEFLGGRRIGRRVLDLAGPKPWVLRWEGYQSTYDPIGLTRP
jgi:hypothetical protein